MYHSLQPHLEITEPAMFCETGPSGMHPSLCLHWINIHLDIRRAFLGCHLLDGYHIRRRTLEHCSSRSFPIQNNRGQESPGCSSSKPHRSNRPGKQFGYTPLVLRVLTMRQSFSHYRTLTRNYSGGAHDCFTRSAKPAGCYPPHMSFNQSSPMSVRLSGAAALQT